VPAASRVPRVLFACRPSPPWSSTPPPWRNAARQEIDSSFLRVFFDVATSWPLFFFLPDARSVRKWDGPSTSPDWLVHWSCFVSFALSTAESALAQFLLAGPHRERMTYLRRGARSGVSVTGMADPRFSFTAMDRAEVACTAALWILACPPL